MSLVTIIRLSGGIFADVLHSVGVNFSRVESGHRSGGVVASP